MSGGARWDVIVMASAAVVVAAMLVVKLTPGRSAPDAEAATPPSTAAVPDEGSTAPDETTGPTVEPPEVVVRSKDPSEVPDPNLRQMTAADVLPEGLRWLHKQQAKDGSWGDPGTTGIALLAYLGAGETPASGSHRETVASGLKYLCGVQDKAGRLAPGLRDHAVAALALVEAYGLTGNQSFKAPAQRAVAFAATSRLPRGLGSGWPGWQDVETTGWMSMLLKSGQTCGLAVDASALDDAVISIDASTDGATGRVTDRGPLSDAASTAMGVHVRIMAGRKPADDEMIRKGVDVVAAAPPVWEEGRLLDPAAWYYGTLVMSRMSAPRWKKWAESMSAVANRFLSTSGRADQLGSWDPPTGSTAVDSRIWSTAFALLGSERAWYGYKREMK